MFQGEDVVSGIRNCTPVVDMGKVRAPISTSAAL